MNRRHHRISRFVAMGLLTVLGGAGASADNSGAMSTVTTGTESGEQIFGHICQGCHMPQAQGAVGAGFYPKLAGDPALVSWQYVAITVLNGKHAMPAFGKPVSGPDGLMAFASTQLSDAEVAGVVNYVRSHFGNRYKEHVSTDQVAALPHPGAAKKP